ncbi:YfhL family 4Fe-4S dicluster ferredoxin [Bacteroidota bacterium]
MALLITKDCIVCGACEPECSNNAITAGEEIYEINPNLCTECIGYYDGPQCATVCPAECIFHDPDNEETKEELLEKKELINANQI